MSKVYLHTNLERFLMSMTVGKNFGIVIYNYKSTHQDVSKKIEEFYTRIHAKKKEDVKKYCPFSQGNYLRKIKIDRSSVELMSTIEVHSRLAGSIGITDVYLAEEFIDIDYELLSTLNYIITLGLLNE